MAQAKRKVVPQVPPQQKMARRRPFNLSLVKRDFEDVLLACEKLKKHSDERVRIPATFMSATLGAKDPSHENLELALAVLGASRKIFDGALHELTPPQIAEGNHAAPFTSLLWPAILEAIDCGYPSQQSKAELVIDFIRRHPIISDSYQKTEVACYPGLKNSDGKALRCATNLEIVGEMQRLWPERSKNLTENDVSKARMEQLGARESSRKEFLDRVLRNGVRLKELTALLR